MVGAMENEWLGQSNSASPAASQSALDVIRV